MILEYVRDFFLGRFSGISVLSVRYIGEFYGWDVALSLVFRL